MLFCKFIINKKSIYLCLKIIYYENQNFSTIMKKIYTELR